MGTKVQNKNEIDDQKWDNKAGTRGQDNKTDTRRQDDNGMVDLK